jgi:hypothetical protein
VLATHLAPQGSQAEQSATEQRNCRAAIGHPSPSDTRLYEQGADSRRIGDYVQRWWGWWEAGLVAERQEATSASPGAVNPLPAGTAGPLDPAP